MKNPHKIEFLVTTIFIVLFILTTIFYYDFAWIDSFYPLATLGLLIMQFIGGVVNSESSTRNIINFSWLGLIVLGFLTGSAGVYIGYIVFYWCLIFSPILIIINWILAAWKWEKFNNKEIMNEFNQEDVLDGGSLL